MRKFILIFIIIFLSILAIFSTISAFKYKQQLQNSNIQIKDLQNTISEYKESQNVFSQESYSIDKKLEKCTSENFITIGMNSCTNEGIEAWNKEILNYSKQIEKYLHKEELLLFTKAQTAWEDYYKKEKDFINKTIAQKDGDIHTTIAIGDLYELTKQRALSLKSYLTQLSE